MMLSADDILTGLLIAVAILLLIVLYHALFVMVDLRKILKRVEAVSHQVEEVVMKPLVMTDKILEWLLEYVQSLEKGSHKKHHHKTIDAE